MDLPSHFLTAPRDIAAGLDRSDRAAGHTAAIFKKRRLPKITCDTADWHASAVPHAFAELARDALVGPNY